MKPYMRPWTDTTDAGIRENENTNDQGILYICVIDLGYNCVSPRQKNLCRYRLHTCVGTEQCLI